MENNTKNTCQYDINTNFYKIIYTYVEIEWNVVNHRENVLRYMCVYMCVYVFAITATPFDLELFSFGITFLMWISKNGFQICFFQSYFPFLYFFKISL